MKSKKHSSERKKNIKADDYINVNEIETNKFVDSDFIDENNSQDKKHKKYMIICLILIILIKSYFLISSKNNINNSSISPDKLINIEDLNQTINNNIIINETIISQDLIKETNNNLTLQTENNKTEILENTISETSKNTILETQKVELTSKLEDRSNVVTTEKIFWKNNTVIDLDKINEEIRSYENMTPSFDNKEELYKRENPKVSLIIPVYNQQHFIKRVYVTIEHQTLKDIEIIFVDDCSKDNSSQIIEEMMQIDKRIVYIKNEENKGAFYSRNKGALNAKGEYIHFVDIDDYLLNDILIKSYETAKMYNLDVLHFYVMAGDFKKNVFWKVLKYRSGIIRGERVKNVFFFGTTRNTWDKFIRRETMIKSIEFMNEKYRNVNYVVFNDDLVIFGLFKVAQSYGFLEEIGYIYNWAVAGSATHIYDKKEYANSIFKSCFTTMEYFYEQTENNSIEKSAGYWYFVVKAYKVCMNNVDSLTEGFDYIFKVIDIYLNSPFYSIRQKERLNMFKNTVLNVKEKVSKENSTINLNNNLNNALNNI